MHVKMIYAIMFDEYNRNAYEFWIVHHKQNFLFCRRGGTLLNFQSTS